jgi:trk system potassium uptake protein TrkA
MRQVAVIGLGKFGSAVAKELAALGAQVIAVDTDKARVDEVKDHVTYAVALNATDAKALRAVGIEGVDAAVVCIGEGVEANLLVTVLLKQIGVKRIWARAINPMQQEILKALEVESIVNLETEMGQVVARDLAAGGVVKHIHVGQGYSVTEIRVPESLVGRTIRQSQARRKYGVNIVAVKRRAPSVTETGERAFEESVESVPEPEMELADGDVLVVAGRERDIARFSQA